MQIIRSRCVDTEALCVLAGKLVWSIKIELRILGTALYNTKRVTSGGAS